MVEEKITFESIQKVNETIRTTGIQKKDRNGNITVKEYAEVNQRVKAFRMLYPEGVITTELISNENGICIIRATIKDNNDRILATGTAYEKESSSLVNKTSYIENCETSAVGRALGFLGIGIDTSIASLEEVQNAIEQQSKIEETTDSPLITEVQVRTLQGLIKQLDKADGKSLYDKLLAKYNIKDFSELKDSHYGQMLVDIQSFSKENINDRK